MSGNLILRLEGVEVDGMPVRVEGMMRGGEDAECSRAGVGGRFGGNGGVEAGKVGIRWTSNSDHQYRYRKDITYRNQINRTHFL